MNDAEYRRLIKMLTVRACRVLKIAAAKGEDWILAAGKSPTDYAAETLILWGTNKLPVHRTSREAGCLLNEGDDERDHQLPAEKGSESESGR